MRLVWGVRRFCFLEGAISEPLSDAWFDVVWARGAMRFGSRERLGRLWEIFPGDESKNNSLARFKGLGGRLKSRPGGSKRTRQERL